MLQFPLASAHQLLQRLEAFQPGIPGGRPQVTVTDEDIDKFFNVFGPTREVLNYALENRPTEEKRREVRYLCKETYFLLQDQLKAYLNGDKKIYQQLAIRMSMVFAKRTRLAFFLGKN